MLDQSLIFVGAVFTLAGFAKGAIGLGLPTIAMGLLAIRMPPLEAAGILLLPSLITNLWQMLAGPALGGVVRRLWPMLLAVSIGTWAGLGLMTGASTRLGTAGLGGALGLYTGSGPAAVGRGVWGLSGAGVGQRVVAWPVGAFAALITAATGVFVIPAVPYLQSIGLEKDELVQALGLSFTVSTVALSINVMLEGGLQVSMAADTVTALVLACAGMWMGRALRQRMAASTFRRCFFAALLMLGLYLAGAGFSDRGCPCGRHGGRTALQPALARQLQASELNPAP